MIWAFLGLLSGHTDLPVHRRPLRLSFFPSAASGKYICTDFCPGPQAICCRYWQPFWQRAWMSPPFQQLLSMFLLCWKALNQGKSSHLYLLQPERCSFPFLRQYWIKNRSIWIYGSLHIVCCKIPVLNYLLCPTPDPWPSTPAVQRKSAHGYHAIPLSF